MRDNYNGPVTPGEISGARQKTKQLQQTLTNENVELAKNLESIMDRIATTQAKLNKDSKAYAKSQAMLEGVHKKINLLKERENLLGQDSQANILDVIELNRDLQNAYIDEEIELDEIEKKIRRNGALTSKNIDDEIKRLDKAIAKKQANAKIEKAMIKRDADEYTGTVDTANKDMLKSTSSALVSIKNAIESTINMINLDKLANGGAELTKTWSIMESTMKNFQISEKEFEKYKNSVVDNLTDFGMDGDWGSIFGAQDITKYLQQLTDMGVKDTETAEKMVSAIAFGNKYLGMSAETQESLYKLQRRSGVENLIERQTATTAQLLRSQLNISKEQLEAINQAAIENADTLSLLGLDGEALANFTESFAKQSAVYEDAYKGVGASGVDALIKGISSDNTTAATLFGSDYNKVYDKFMETGDVKELLEAFKDSNGAVKSMAETYGRFVENKDYVGAKSVVEEAQSMGVNGDILKLFYQMQKNPDALQKSNEKLETQEEEDKGKSSEEIINDAAKMIADTLTDEEKLQNQLSAELLKFDWSLLRKIASWGGILAKILGFGINILNIISWFKGGKWLKTITSALSKGFGGIKTALSSLGSGIKGLFSSIGSGLSSLFGAGSTMGGSMGVSLKTGLGNGLLQKAGVAGGLLWTAADAFGGATKMADQLSTRKGGPDGWGRFGFGVMGAVSGTSVATKQNAYNGLTGKAMKGLGMSEDTAASVKNIGGGALSGAAKGALIGSVVPGVGTAIGAAVGGVVGLIGGLFKDSKRKEKEEQERREAERKAREEAKRQKEQLEHLAAIDAATAMTAKNTAVGGYAERNRYYTLSAFGNASEGIGVATPPAMGNANMDAKGGMFGGVDISPWVKTSDYGGREVLNTSTGKSSPQHNGIDFAGRPFGSAIGSATAGRVVAVRTGHTWNDGTGIANYVDVYNPENKLTYRYWHLAGSDARVGQEVNAGDTIGYVGNTGSVYPAPSAKNPTAGTHLHFAVLKNGSYINPTNYVTAAIFGAQGTMKFAKSGSKSTSGGMKKSKAVADSHAQVLKRFDANAMASVGATGAAPYDDSKVLGGIEKLNNTILEIAARQNEQQKIIDALSTRPIGKISY